MPDLFTPDGFVAGQMIVQALTGAKGDDVDKMISALEGWNFVGPKGQQSIRAVRPRHDPADVPGQAGEAGERQVGSRRSSRRIKGQFVAPPEPKQLEPIP